MLKKQNQRGFSIIEVLIVLAIAGLIMLVVFLAVPALQRNARNNARQSDASKFAAAINQCLSNNNGKYTNCNTVGAINAPTGITWDSNDNDGTTDASQLTDAPIIAELADDVVTNASKTQMTWIFGRKCDGAGTLTGTTREFVVVYKTEGGGGNDALACISS